MEKKWNMGRLKGLAKTAGAAAATLAVSFCSALPAHAAGVNDSQIVKGTERLIGDVTTWLMVLAPVVAGLLIIYFCPRRMRWTRRNGTTALWWRWCPASEPSSVPPPST